MIPEKLILENFHGHSLSEIDFNDFSSAVIIGKYTDNPTISNGVGKSTLFKAIEYALFNEAGVKSLEKIIRLGTKLAKVTFDFTVYLGTYRIIRMRKKSTSDVRFYKKNNDDWDDLTQRRASDTEKEIAKVVKINYKAFCNSVLFSQDDFRGLPALTPEKRKSLLKDVLQLANYTKLEIIAKKRLSDIVKETDSLNNQIKYIGTPDLDITGYNRHSSLLKEEIINYTNSIHSIEKEITTKNSDLLKIKSLHSSAAKDSLEFISKEKSLIKEVSTLSSTVEGYNTKVNSLKDSGTLLANEIKSLKESLNNLQKIKSKSLLDLDKEIDELKLIINKNTNKIYSFNEKLQELSIPIPQDGECKHCRQILSDEHRKSCQEKINSDISSIKEKVKELNKSIKTDNDILSLLEKEKKMVIFNKDTINTLVSTIEFKTKELESKRNLYTEFMGLYKANKILLEDKKNELVKIEEGKANTNPEAALALEKQILTLTNEIAELTDNLRKTNNVKNKMNSEQAILLSKIEAKEKDLLKIENIKKDLLLLQDKFVKHQQVVTAFGSTGIPTLIIHTLLDDLQIETNRLLDQLKPGLQLKFKIDKENTKGDQEDTLDIIYYLNGNEFDYEQLSGGQKIIVAITLKLGLSSVIQKKIGTDIKFLMLDEGDQSLDDYSLEAYLHIIKELQKEYKILVVTHNKNLKDKFSHAIVVEQDKDLSSKAKVTTLW